MHGPGRSVLFVGINYAPEETGIAPYTTDLAEHLAARGWQVTVLAGMPHYPRWRVSSAYRRRFRAREERNGVEVQRFRHYVPRSQSAARRGLYELTFLAHGATATSLRRPDCVVGVVPSLSGGVIARLQARRFRVPYGLIIQDLVSPAAAQSGVPGAAAMARPVRAVEAGIARRATAISVITQSFRPYLLDAGVDADRIVDVPNWTHVSRPSGRAGEIRRSWGWDEDVSVVLHAGNMGYKQGLDNVVEMARLAGAEGRPLRFVLMGDGSDRKRLESLGQDVDALEFLDPQPAEVFMDVLAAADVLVLNERASVRDMSLPGKITSYFLSGRPVVAAVRRDGVTARELERSGGALVVAPEDPATLLDAVSDLVADQHLKDRLVSAASVFAEQHLDRSTLLARAERFVAGLASGGSGTQPIEATTISQ
ncbi:MAG: glycosyltransferase [Actinobacteria bacterium]|nr:glycosyltransferase [Actinomycetota bacterium]